MVQALATCCSMADCLTFPSEQHDNVERHRDWLQFGIKRRSRDVPGIRTHHDRAADCGTAEDHAPAEPVNRRLSDPAPRGLGVASGSRLVLRQQPEAASKL